MSTAGSKPGKSTFAGYKVKANAVIVKGVGVILSNPGEIDVAGANGKVFAVAAESVTGNADGTSRCEAQWCDGGSARVKLSGTATAGEFAIAGVGGFENQTLGGGNTVKYIAGRFLESGIAGDYVEMLLNGFAAGAA